MPPSTYGCGVDASGPHGPALGVLSRQGTGDRPAPTSLRLCSEEEEEMELNANRSFLLGLVVNLVTLVNSVYRDLFVGICF
jgi:hypothetical protein